MGKATGGKREGAGRKPDGDRSRNVVTNLRSTPEWKVAISELAEWDRATTVAELIDRAIAHYARERGYPNPIPRR